MKRVLKRLFPVIVVTAALLGIAISAIPASALDDAHSYDMTWRGATDTVNGAIISAFTPTDSTGTGYWHSFLRISSNSTVVKGYNSDYKKSLEFNEDASWTQSFLLKDVPQVMVEGTLYREFQLDINQNSNGTDALISIDELEVWLTNTLMDEDLTPKILYPFIDDATMDFVWGLDEQADNVILLNFGLNPGSGKRDFKIQIPDALFDATKTYVVLYTEHGGDAYTGYYDLDANPATTGDRVAVNNVIFGNNDGFEEWGVTKYPATKLGTKFNDLNADGVWDAGEPGLGGFTIYVDYDGDGVLDLGEPFAVTSSDSPTLGQYTITGIEPGIYDVREVPQAGWICSFPAGGYYESEEFGNGAYIMGNDFGNYQRGSLTVTKAVVNGTGLTQDFTINVIGPSPSTAVVGTHTFSLVNGVLQPPTSFTFSDLMPGTYTVSETSPGGQWAVTGGGSVVVTAGQTASSTVTNTWVDARISIGTTDTNKVN
ncbi:hypothetical protein DD509_07320, partial [Dehalogenimonas alkenigignens]